MRSLRALSKALPPVIVVLTGMEGGAIGMSAGLPGRRPRTASTLAHWALRAEGADDIIVAQGGADALAVAIDVSVTRCRINRRALMAHLSLKSTQLEVALP